MMTSSMTLMRVVYIRADDQEVRLEALEWKSRCSVVDFDFIDKECLQRNNIQYDGIDLNEFF